MKKIIYLLLFIFLGCQTQESPISIIQDIIKESSLIDDDKLNYLNADKISKDAIISIYKSGFANKVDKNVNELEWPLNINQLEKIKSKDEKNLWSDKDFNLKLFENDDDSLMKLAKEFAKKEANLFSISNVYFNESRTCALFGFGQTTDLNLSERFVIVLVKQNDKWKVVNKIVDSTLY